VKNDEDSLRKYAVEAKIKRMNFGREIRWHFCWIEERQLFKSSITFMQIRWRHIGNCAGNRQTIGAHQHDTMKRLSTSLGV
jgi:hypothetical protein